MRAAGHEVNAVPPLDVGRLDLLLEELEFPDPGNRDLVLVGHEAAIEVNGERQEYDEHRYEDDAGRPRRHLGEVVELDPAEDRDLQQEEEKSEEGGEGPGDLYVPVESLVRRLVDEADAVQVADRLDVGQDAGRYHQGEHVHGHEEGRAHGERDQHLVRDLGVRVELHLDHGHLRLDQER